MQPDSYKQALTPTQKLMHDKEQEIKEMEKEIMLMAKNYRDSNYLTESARLIALKIDEMNRLTDELLKFR